MCILPFFSNDLKIYDIIQDTICSRSLNRSVVFLNALDFHSGDILIVVFWAKGFLYRFEGICICLRKKKFKEPDVCIILRNIILGVGVEFSISYFYNRIFYLTISDYKRKHFIYRKSKLYYLRTKLNRESRVKEG